MLLGRDPAWRLDAAAPVEAQGPWVASMLPAWLPGEAAAHPQHCDGDGAGTMYCLAGSEGDDDGAADAAAIDEEVTAKLLGIRLEGHPAQEGQVAAPVTGGDSGRDSEQAVDAANTQGSVVMTSTDAAGRADSEAAERARRCHVVLAAILWPRLCELQPDLSVKLRARSMVHLVAESRVRRPCACAALLQ